jgi:hypothetical protein
MDGQSAKETTLPAARAQPKPDAGASARKDRDAEVYASAAASGGLIAAAAGNRIKEFPVESSPRSIPKQSEPVTFATEQEAAKVPEVDGPGFDAIDAQLQDDWDELMEAAERGDFGASHASDQLAIDADEDGPIRPIRRG